jgi:hypothetical protein
VAVAPLPPGFLSLTIPRNSLAFGQRCRQIARHENRRELHYLRHYYPLSIAGGAVFFTL